MRQTMWLKDFRANLGLPTGRRFWTALDQSADTAVDPQTTKQRNAVLFAVVLIAAAVICGVFGVKYWLKTRNTAYVPEQSITMPAPMPAPRPIIQTQNLQTEQRLAKTEQDIMALQTNMKGAYDRLAIVGSLLNNNVAVIANRAPREDLVYINGDWTIDRAPGHLTDNAALQPFVR